MRVFLLPPDIIIITPGSHSYASYYTYLIKSFLQLITLYTFLDLHIQWFVDGKSSLFRGLIKKK